MYLALDWHFLRNWQQLKYWVQPMELVSSFVVCLIIVLKPAIIPTLLRGNNYLLIVLSFVEEEPCWKLSIVGAWLWLTMASKYAKAKQWLFLSSLVDILNYRCISEPFMVSQLVLHCAEAFPACLSWYCVSHSNLIVCFTHADSLWWFD